MLEPVELPQVITQERGELDALSLVDVLNVVGRHAEDAYAERVILAMRVDRSYCAFVERIW